MNERTPLVGILLGSKSDWETMQQAAQLLDEFGVPHEERAASAHRSPELVAEYARSAEKRGLEVIIAAAGLAAHLPGVVASLTLLPVLGVPMQGKALGGLDALLAIAQMPGGVPVGTLAIGSAGAERRPSGCSHPRQLAARTSRSAPPLPRTDGRTDQKRHA